MGTRVRRVLRLALSSCLESLNCLSFNWEQAEQDLSGQEAVQRRRTELSK